MLSPSRYLRPATLAAALLLTGLVAGCTITPVHGTGEAGVSLARGSVDDRREQIAYRTLENRLSFAESDIAPRLELSVSVSNAAIGSSSVSRPATEREMLATITYRVVSADGATTIATGSRTARATYFSSPQALGDETARIAAEERAIAAAAEAVRLVLLAQFGAP